MDYKDFIERRSQIRGQHGFDPVWMPDFLFDFQRDLVEWSVRKGRAAIFADCGLGKTPMQLVWAENVVRHEWMCSKVKGRVLILTPLAVSHQTEREAVKFGIDAKVSRDGSLPANIVIANYEQLQKFSPKDFAGVVCDESSILKSFGGVRRKQITRFMNKLKYRLLCTATAAPNDYVELGTSSEALGEPNHSEMLRRFFRQLDDKGQKKETKQQDQAERMIEADPSYFQKLAYRVAQTIGQWRLKHHAVIPFWRWVASWARACRKPSDLGFEDDGFVLPPLVENDHVIKPSKPPPGFLFNVPAFGLGAERTERRRTLQERCDYVRQLVAHDRPALIWCQMNPEGDLLEQIIPNAVQIAGRHSDDYKCDVVEWFVGERCICDDPRFAKILTRWPKADGCRCGKESGNRKLVSKSKIFGYGLNLQHCNHVVGFVTHSFEQDYQGIRRCWRFGQKSPVTVDRVCVEGEVRILGNLKRKAQKADEMFERLVQQMSNATRLEMDDSYTQKEEIPAWLSKTS